jgi:hypothetical protein
MEISLVGFMTSYRLDDTLLIFIFILNAATPRCVFDTLNEFGYDEFRPNQEKIIMNILSGSYTATICHDNVHTC